MRLQESRAGRRAGDVGTARGIVRQAVEPIPAAACRPSGCRRPKSSPSAIRVPPAPAPTASAGSSAGTRQKASIPASSPVMPEKTSSAQGRLAISTELSAANTHSTTSPRRAGPRASACRSFPQVQQDRPALEQREVAVGQPRNLAERLVREMPGFAVTERRALDPVGQPRLFQRPAHAQGERPPWGGLLRPLRNGVRDNRNSVQAQPAIASRRTSLTDLCV